MQTTINLLLLAFSLPYHHCIRRNLCSGKSSLLNHCINFLFCQCYELYFFLCIHAIPHTYFFPVSGSSNLILSQSLNPNPFASLFTIFTNSSASSSFFVLLALYTNVRVLSAAQIASCAVLSLHPLALYNFYPYQFSFIYLSMYSSLYCFHC